MDGEIRPVRTVSATLAGELLLGVAFARAALRPRGAGVLLAAGAVVSLLVPLLPHALARYAAVPVGLAIVWLGASLWSERRRAVTSSAAERRSTPFGVAAE